MRSLNNDEHKRVDVVSTFLGAHAVPAEYNGQTDEYVDYIIREVMPVVVHNNLAEFCDVFCEQGVFSIEQSRRLLLAAKEMGLALKLHADEIVPLGVPDWLLNFLPSLPTICCMLRMRTSAPWPTRSCGDPSSADSLCFEGTLCSWARND